MSPVKDWIGGRNVSDTTVHADKCKIIIYVGSGPNLPGHVTGDECSMAATVGCKVGRKEQPKIDYPIPGWDPGRRPPQPDDTGIARAAGAGALIKGALSIDIAPPFRTNAGSCSLQRFFPLAASIPCPARSRLDYVQRESKRETVSFSHSSGSYVPGRCSERAPRKSGASKSPVPRHVHAE